MEGIAEDGIKVREVNKDHFLIREGDESSHLYIVKSGNFAILINKGGAEKEIQNIGENGMIGEMSFIDGSKRSASVRAKELSSVYEIPKENFDKFFKKLPRWYVALFETIIRRIRSTNARIKI